MNIYKYKYIYASVLQPCLQDFLCFTLSAILTYTVIYPGFLHLGFWDLCSYFLNVVSNLNWSFHNYYLSGSTYEKDGTKQSKARDNYRGHFKKTV